MPRDRLNKLLLGVSYRRPSTIEQRKKLSERNKSYKLHELNRFKRSYEFGCAICKEMRVVEICHIIPVSRGGSNEPSNLIVLCPTHHTLFDRDKLNDSEMDMIYEKLDIAYGYSKSKGVAY